MRIALAIPSYQQRVHIQTAHAWAQDMACAMEMGWRPLLLWTDCNNIEVARNTIVQQALQADARLLLMCDSDTMPVPLEGGLKNMWQAMSDTGAAVVGAAVPVRNGTGMNCEPARPGEIYHGVVGSAYLLLDLFKLRNVPRPWFKCVLDETGTAKAIGSDIGFCNLVRESGLDVVVNFALSMAHAEVGAVATRV
jgi:hypothetical protein